MSPVRLQAITLTNADLLSIGPLGTNFSEIRNEIQNFSFMKMHAKIPSAKKAAILFRGNELTQNPWFLFCLTLETDRATGYTGRH